jgi:hypothetical protein
VNPKKSFVNFHAPQVKITLGDDNYSLDIQDEYHEKIELEK